MSGYFVPYFCSRKRNQRFYLTAPYNPASVGYNTVFFPLLLRSQERVPKDCQLVKSTLMQIPELSVMFMLIESLPLCDRPKWRVSNRKINSSCWNWFKTSLFIIIIIRRGEKKNSRNKNKKGNTESTKSCLLHESRKGSPVGKKSSKFNQAWLEESSSLLSGCKCRLTWKELAMCTAWFRKGNTRVLCSYFVLYSLCLIHRQGDQIQAATGQVIF